MTTLKEAAQRLLNARDRFGWSVEVDAYFHKLRDVLASEPQAEPVAWRWAPAFREAGRLGLRADWQDMPPPAPESREIGQIEYAFSAHPAPPVEQPASVKESLTVEQPGAVGLSDDDIEWPDTESAAHSCVQEALSFGLSFDVIHRHMLSVMFKTAGACRAALAAAQPAAPGWADGDGTLPPAYMLAKLKLVMPVFQEARDALPAITEQVRRLRGISATLADRMDEAGTFSLDDWLAAQFNKEQG